MTSSWFFSSVVFTVTEIQYVPLATEPGISLIILTPMKIMQRNLNRSAFVVWEMKMTVSAVRFKFRCNILISGKIIKEMQGSVASGTYCTKYTVRYNNLLPYNSALRVSAHQNLHQASLLQRLQKGKCICNMQILRPRWPTAWVYGRSPAEIVGSNPTRGMDVCLL